MKKKYQRQTVIAGYAFAIELLIHGFPDFKLREYSISPKYHVIAAKIIYIISFWKTKLCHEIENIQVKTSKLEITTKSINVVDEIALEGFEIR